MPAQEKVTSEQRIFSLLLALAASQHGVTKTEILSTVHGYAQKFDNISQRKNLERQFERDKDALRQLGIPIETFEAPGDSGNNQQSRYRIPLDSLSLTPNIGFSERELTLLKLASFAWRDSTLSSEARLATLKLASLGHELDTALFGIAPMIQASDPSFEALRDATERCVEVEFSYRKPTDTAPQPRRVAPLSLEKVDGRWHLIAWDCDRDATRIFLLSRIQGAVLISNREFSKELCDHTQPALDQLKLLRASQVAKIVRRPGSEAETRLGEIINYLDEDMLAEELVEFGADVFVVEPTSLRARVIELLRAVAILHDDRSESEAT